MRRILFLAAIAVGCAPPPAVEPREGGIVSLDYCADPYAIHLVPADNIIAVSKDAAASYAYSKDAAASFPSHSGRAEDILALDPSVVIRSYGGQDVLPHLRRAGVEIVDIGFPSTLAQTRNTLRDVGRALDAAPEKIEALLATTGSNDHPATGKTALYITPGGVTAGPGTVIDELIVAAGYTNFETRNFWPSLPLEQLATASPDVIITSFFDSEFGQTSSWSAANHPVMKDAIKNSEHIRLPASLTSCSAWYTADAIDILATPGASR